MYYIRWDSVVYDDTFGVLYYIMLIIVVSGRSHVAHAATNLPCAFYDYLFNRFGTSVLSCALCERAQYLSVSANAAQTYQDNTKRRAYYCTAYYII